MPLNGLWDEGGAIGYLCKHTHPGSTYHVIRLSFTYLKWYQQSKEAGIEAFRVKTKLSDMSAATFPHKILVLVLSWKSVTKYKKSGQ